MKEPRSFVDDFNTFDMFVWDTEADDVLFFFSDDPTRDTFFEIF